MNTAATAATPISPAAVRPAAGPARFRRGHSRTPAPSALVTPQTAGVPISVAARGVRGAGRAGRGRRARAAVTGGMTRMNLILRPQFARPP